MGHDLQVGSLVGVAVEKAGQGLPLIHLVKKIAKVNHLLVIVRRWRRRRRPLVLHVVKDAPELLKQTQDMSDQAYHQMLVQQIGIYGAVAAVCTLLAVLLVFKIADHEGRGNYFRSIWKRKEKNAEGMPVQKKPGFITVSLIIAVLVAVGFMFISM